VAVIDLARVSAVLAVVGALSGCGSSPEPAPPTQAEAEQLYLVQMKLHGVHYPGSPNTDLMITDRVALDIGNQVCTTLRNPVVTADMVGAVLTDKGNFSARDAGSIVGAAVGNLCPDMRSKLA
jgi:hypothetical protein